MENRPRGTHAAIVPHVVLAVGAHPDDIEFGCFATLMKRIRDYHDEIFLLVLTDGESGLKHMTELSDEEKRLLRRNEARVSARTIGIKTDHVLFANEIIEKKEANLTHSAAPYELLQDGFLQDHDLVVDIIENVIVSKRVSVVYTQSPSDRHQDHRRAGSATLAAARYVPEVYEYEGPSTLGFLPEQFFTITERDLQRKQACLERHKSQVNKNPTRHQLFRESTGWLARYRGYQSACYDYHSDNMGEEFSRLAEAFKVARQINL